MTKPFVENPWQLQDTGVATIRLRQDDYPTDVRRELRRVLTTELGYRDADTVLDAFDWKIAGSRLSKRTSAAVYKTLNQKLPDAAIQRIGELAATVRPVEAIYDITHAFDWAPGDYRDPNSCYWGTFRRARTYILPRFNACAVRVYNVTPGGNLIGNGRVWLLPTNKVRGMFVSFNYYGAFGTTDYARQIVLAILAEQFGGEWAARPVALRVEDAYINDPTKFLYYPLDRNTPSGVPIRDKAERINTVTFTRDMAQSMHFVEPAWASNEEDDYVYCRTCYGNRMRRSEARYGHGIHTQTTYCQTCYDRLYGRCEMCDYTFARSDLREVSNITLCQGCRTQHVFTCGICDRERLASATAHLEETRPNLRTVGRFTMRNNEGHLRSACRACYRSSATCPTCNHRYNDSPEDGCPACRNRSAARGRITLRLGARQPTQA